MKFLVSQLSFFLKSASTKRNTKLLLRFLAVLIIIISAYSTVFHYIMEAEGQHHSWVTGFYWTLTVMSTLGFGDITFTSDLGRIFSILVLVSGVILLLIILPFTIIQFFYAPWIEAQAKARAPKELPVDTKDHIILTSFDPVTEQLIRKIRSYDKEYVLLEEDLQRALELHDLGYRVAVGSKDDPDTYKRMQIDNAALVVSTNKDEVSSSIVYTVRELTQQVPIISIANSHDSVDILEIAGSSLVLQISEMMGKAFSRRIAGGESKANIVGQFDKLLIAEAPVIGTPLVGKTLQESKLRELIGINVVGLWERGHFESPRPDTVINNNTVLVLAGSDEQLMRFDEIFCIYHVSDAPIVIIGGGRVGRATAAAFRERNISYTIIEKLSDRVENTDNYVLGNAADLEVLEKAGIRETPTTIITTHDDATNIYLTIYCRKLRPDLHIISRANLDRNISTLHRAGADFVISYSSLGANAIFNYFRKNDVLMLAEGLHIFKSGLSAVMKGLSLSELNIRQKTGCSVIAIKKNGEVEINPDPYEKLDAKSELIVIGTVEAEKNYFEEFSED